MVQIPLQEIITAHTDTLAHHYEEFVLLIRLLRLLGEETSVSPEHLATTTHHTREEIELTPEHVEHYEPERAVVSIIVPTTGAVSKASTTEDIWLAFCSHVHFFSSREAASAWFVGKHYEPLLLSIEEGYELGRLRFAEMLKEDRDEKRTDA